MLLTQLLSTEAKNLAGRPMRDHECKVKKSVFRQAAAKKRGGLPTRLTLSIGLMGELTTLHRNVSSTLIVAARRWRRTSAAVLLQLNISEACAAALLAAHRLDMAVRQITLAEHVGIEGASLVRLLDQLCDAGLVRRDADPDDRRAKIISLTDRGRTAAVEMERRLIALHSRMLGDLSKSDLEATLRVLAAFSASDQSEDDLSEEPRLGEGNSHENGAGPSTFNGS